MWTKQDIINHFTNLQIPTQIVLDYIEGNSHRGVGDFVEAEFLQHSGLDYNTGQGVDLPNGFNGDNNPYEIKTQEISTKSHLTIGGCSRNTFEITNGMCIHGKLTTNLIFVSWCKEKGVITNVKFINNNTAFVQNDVATQLSIAAGKLKLGIEVPKHHLFFKENEFPFVVENQGNGSIKIRLTQKQLIGRSNMMGMLFN